MGKQGPPKGVSNNPSGKSKLTDEQAKVLKDTRKSLYDLGERAVEVLKEIMDSAPVADQLRAAMFIVEQNLGKASQRLELAGDPNAPLIPIREKSSEELMAICAAHEAEEKKGKKKC